MNVQSLFAARFGSAPTFTARAPGRVNLLGEHVDYNGGPVLPVAIDRAVYLAGTPVNEPVVHIYAADLGKEIVFSLEDLVQKVDQNGNRLPSWALYPAGVAWSLQQSGLPLQGLQAVFTSDVPIGAGLSSSAAVEVGFAVLWGAISGWSLNRIRLAQLCQRAENQYVGVNSGLMDQFASANGVGGHALFFDTRSLAWHPVPMPAGTAVVIADSGMRRTLAGSAYNERRAACEQAVDQLKEFIPGITSLRDVSTTEFAAYSDRLSSDIRRRAEHVVKEIARVNSAVTALQRQEAHAFGALMFSGHASLRDLYEVSIPELDKLVEIARGLPGILGARLTGAGFGGCTVNLVQESQAGVFIQGLKDGYHQETGREAQVYLCQASPGASVEEV